MACMLLLVPLAEHVQAAASEFDVVEATIDDIQTAIQQGETTCEGVVRAYLARAKAYNGACTALVTADGSPIPAASGYIRAGAPIVFPTQTIPVSRYLPNLDQYQGPPLDLGRMEATASDPGVVQQYGMVMGLPNAGQVNALETINLRGERSVTCKGAFDAHPSTGPLPADAPAVCEKFRQMPDALERAAQLDAEYGSKPDLAKLPMYCAVVSVKDWYDVKDMRSTGGNDVNFAMDAPPDDSTVVAELREKGAIIYAVTIAAEVNFSEAGPNKPERSFVGGGGSIRSSWGGHVCNPYDTERSAGPSSGGAGVSVSANLVTCAICETTGGSCREPAGQNSLASLVTTKGLTSEDGSMTARFINHRPGALCKTIADSARVLESIRNPLAGYFDSKDIFTAIPEGLTSTEPYTSYVVDAEALADKPLQGKRIGIVREYMVHHTPNDAAISDRVDAEIKSVLRDKLGAEIVESEDPQYPDDPAVANMTYTFQDALAEILPLAAPEYFLQMKGDEPEFAVPGYDVRTTDYLVKLSLGQAPLSPKLNMRRILSGLDEGNTTEFSAQNYLAERGDARITDLAAYAANSKWRADSQMAGLQNAAALSESNAPMEAPQGIDRIKMQAVFRMVMLKVMRENGIDLFVHPNIGVPQWKIGFDREPTVNDRLAAGPSVTDLLGVPEITIPAGFNQIVYEPAYVLNDDKKGYTLVTGATQSMMKEPMPFSINFWAGPGDEPILLQVSSAYEAATKHRRTPAAFGPVK